MIDTDKYEGHSEMIDANEIGEIWEYLADTISEDRLERAEANYNLVADAPDLLAEVKRLREELRILNGMNNALWNTVENYDICLDDFTMIDLLSPPDGYEYCEDELRWVKKE